MNAVLETNLEVSHCGLFFQSELDLVIVDCFFRVS